MIDLLCEYIFPHDSLDFKSQAINLISQIHELSHNSIIVRAVFFIDCNNNSDYNSKQKMISEMLDIKMPDHSMLISVIAQKPLMNSSIAAEISYYEESSDIRFSQSSIGTFSAVEISKSGQTEFHGSVSSGPEGNLYEKTEPCFYEIEKYLHSKNLDFSNIVRQWNYIENITGSSLIEKDQQENYNIFNNVRSQYYGRCNFLKSYPAATGIGVSAGGIIIDFIATDNSDKRRIFPLKNPNQTESYDYSSEVLVSKTQNKKNTPKFERGKIVKSENNMTIFISGTAAIVGERSVPFNDLKSQTRQTFENIFHLIKHSNLPKEIKSIKHLACLDKEDPELLYQAINENIQHARVYVKKNSIPDYNPDFINQFLKEANFIALEADICREELLVEIEGIVTINLQDS